MNDKVVVPKLVLGILIGVAITFVLILVLLTLSLNHQSIPVAVVPAITPTTAPSPPVAPSVAPTFTTLPSDFGQISWYSSPQKITNPSVLNPTTPTDNGVYQFSDLGSYEVGQFSHGAKLIISFIVPDGPMPPYPFRIISDHGQYFLVESLIGDDYTMGNLGLIFDQTKIRFISLQLKGLSFNSNYSINQNNLTSTTANEFSSASFYSVTDNFKSLGSTPDGDMLYRDTPITTINSAVVRRYFLKLADFTLAPYKLSPSLSFTVDKVPRFTLLNGSANTFQYTPPKYGCGSGNDFAIITNQSLLSSKVLIGHSANSIDIFQITSVDNPLVKDLYNQYKVGRDYPSGPPILSLEEFAKAPNHLIYQEKNGDYLLFINPDYAIQAECGKPVIYLYPPKDTQVSVKVGANITKSEPIYSPTGWTVLAHPNGKLDLQNHSYPNLFWEGTGIGTYNNHSGEGFVVSQTDLVSSLKSQLLAQGLNAQESADFLTFWQPKLPTTPYVRLTWLNTADMNQLAPLQVSPLPKTVIRTFLEFEGLAKPITLIPQKFSAPSRLGFTLVEWGGLLK